MGEDGGVKGVDRDRIGVGHLTLKLERVPRIGRLLPAVEPELGG